MYHSTIYIQSLYAKNFKNLFFKEEENFSPSLNLIQAPNGSGKTNFLELLFFLGHQRTFKKIPSQDYFFNFSTQEEIYAKADIKMQIPVEFINSYELLWNNPKTRPQWFLNKKKIHTSLKQLSLIFLGPGDYSQFFLSREMRVFWFDYYLSRLNETFLLSLKRYQQALKQRNALLKQSFHWTKLLDDQLHSLTESMMNDIVTIVSLRKSFVEDLNLYLKEHFNALFEEKLSLSIDYKPNVSFYHTKDRKDLLAELLAKKSKELALKYTLVGPHKDDFFLLLNGKNIFYYGSLGQQKMSYYSLVFAYISYIRYKFKMSPSLLLDDLSGELDAQRWDNLVQFISHMESQIFVTTANEFLCKKWRTKSFLKEFTLKNGHILSCL